MAFIKHHDMLRFKICNHFLDISVIISCTAITDINRNRFRKFWYLVSLTYTVLFVVYFGAAFTVLLTKFFCLNCCKDGLFTHLKFIGWTCFSHRTTFNSIGWKSINHLTFNSRGWNFTRGWKGHVPQKNQVACQRH